MNEKRKNIAFGGMFTLAYAALAGMCYQMYLRQAIHFPGKLGVYDSDLPAHIQEGRANTAYSLMERSFGFLMNDLGQNEKAVAIWLALLTVGTVWMTYCLMRRLFPKGNAHLLHVLAFAASFVMPIYLPEVNPYRYLGMQSGTIWHNSTYLGMKFAAVCVLLFYYKYQENYRKQFAWKDFLWFTILLIFVNLMKPNFILCFAPAMAIMLLTDCIAERGRRLKQQILFGIPVLISLAVVVYETMVLFSGENDGSSITVALAYNLRLWTEHPILALLQSAAFPLIVLAANRKDLKNDRLFRVSWLIWLVGLLEYLFLCEEGPRKNHGNLSWGYSFCMFLIFVISILWLYKNLKAFHEKYRASGSKGLVSYIRNGDKRSAGQVIYLGLALVFLLWHLGCGLHFSWMAYLGGSYIC